MDINESSAYRLYRKLSGEDSVFAIISPYRGEYDSQENQKRMTHLKSAVRKLGLGFDQFICRWAEGGEFFEEGSLLVSDIDYKTAIKLGAKYDQSSIVYKDICSLREICVTTFETYKPGDIVRTFNIEKDMLNIKDKEYFELYQVYDPRPRYFQTNPVIEKLY